MKKVSLFLISVTLLWGTIKLLQKTKENHRVYNKREQEMLNQIAVGYKDNEIAGLLHTNERTILQCESNILKKTNLPDISSAIQYALEKGTVKITYA